MFNVSTKTVRFISDAYPGVVAGELVDAFGNVRSFQDEVPVIALDRDVGDIVTDYDTVNQVETEYDGRENLMRQWQKYCGLEDTGRGNVTPAGTATYAGTVTEQIGYGASGKAPVYDSVSGKATVYGGPAYCGYWLDLGTGGDLARSRCYTNGQATWIFKDPIAADISTATAATAQPSTSIPAA